MYTNIKLHLINIIIMILIFTGCNRETANSRVSSTPRFITPYIFISQWGSKGNENGQFNTLVDIAVTSKSEVYIIDHKIISTLYNTNQVESYRIQKFDSNGKFIKKWGNKCKITGKMDIPEHIAIDSKDYVYVTNSGNGCIQKFDSNGKFIKKWGGFRQIIKNIPFGIPYGVGIDFNGYIYVTNMFSSFKRSNGGAWISKYDNNGNFITKWEEEFDIAFLGDITIDRSGYIYVVASCFSYYGFEEASIIYKLNKSGQIITNLYPDQGKQEVYESPLDITTDLQDNILIANVKINKIELFDPNGAFIITFGTEGDGDGQFKNPRGIAIDSKGNLYIADTGNYRIQKFKPNPEFKSK